MNDWNECLARMTTGKGELITKEKKPSESKQFAEIGKSLAEGFAAGLESGGFVMMSRKDYDAMVDEFNICIEERDREMFKLDKELREVTEERDQYLDILRKIGITEEYLEKMIPSSLGVGMDENPMTREKRVTIQFRLREV